MATMKGVILPGNRRLALQEFPFQSRDTVRW